MRPDLKFFTRSSAEDIPQKLRELSAELPPPYDWAEFNRRGRDRFVARRTLVKWPHAAAAAGLTAFVAAMAMLGTGQHGKADSGNEMDGPAVAEVSAPLRSRELNPMEAANEEMSGGQAPTAGEAQQARDWLARQPAEPALVRVGPRIAVANLEDRIAWFDDALTSERVHGANADYVRVLQQERARLVSSLAQVRYAETLAADGS
jgi:hypothetical protein